MHRHLTVSGSQHPSSNCQGISQLKSGLGWNEVEDQVTPNVLTFDSVNTDAANCFGVLVQQFHPSPLGKLGSWSTVQGFVVQSDTVSHDLVGHGWQCHPDHSTQVRTAKAYPNSNLGWGGMRWKIR